MSLYRHNVRQGVLIREKRSFVMFWRWPFNRSEEDRLNIMKNELTIAKAAQVRLVRQLKKEGTRLDEAKKKLREDVERFAKLPAWRDRWTMRLRPVLLVEEQKVARTKKERPKVVAPRRKPLLEILQPR